MASIEVSYGYGNSAKGGRRLPLTVTLSGHETEDLRGTIEVLTRQSDDEIYSYVFPAVIPAGQSVREELTVPLGVGSDQIALRLLSETGAAEAVKRVKLNISTTPPELFIGLLSDSPGDLQYFDGVSVNYGQLRTRAFGLDAQSFPSDRDRLDTLDVIIVNGIRMSSLKVEQTRALMRWMRDGGVLLFGTGAHPDDTLGVFAPEFLEDMYDAPEEREISLSAFQNLDAPGSGELTLPLTELSLHGGSTVLSADSVPLVSSVNQGKGVLAAAAFDFADLSSYAREHSGFADLLLTRILGESRLERLASEAYGTEYDAYWSAQSLIDAGAGGKLPEPGIYGALLCACVLLCGPVLWFLLKRRGRTILYRRIAALTALLFAAAVYAAGSGTRFQDTFCTYVLVREAGENTVNDTAYLSLRTPYTASCTASVPERYSVTPLTAALNQGRTDTITGEEEARVTIFEENGEKKITAKRQDAFQARSFRLEHSGANQAGEGFTGSLYLFDEEYSGTVRNAFPFPVKNAAVLLHGKVIPLGDLLPGEETEISGRALYHSPMNDNYTVASFLTGVYDGSADLPARITALEQANFLAWYLSDSETGYSADARVIGFMEEPPEGAPEMEDRILSDEKLQISGLTLVVSALPVDSRDGDLLYRSMLSGTPDVISGDYLSETNSFYRGEPVVLGYLPGYDIRISELIFEEADPVFDSADEREGSHSFHGTISLYNYSTGNFDDLPPEERRLTGEELSGYLSPDNMLTVRYAEAGDAAGSRLDIALPIPFCIGEEN